MDRPVSDRCASRKLATSSGSLCKCCTARREAAGEGGGSQQLIEGVRTCVSRPVLPPVLVKLDRHRLDLPGGLRQLVPQRRHLVTHRRLLALVGLRGHTRSQRVTQGQTGQTGVTEQTVTQNQTTLPLTTSKRHQATSWAVHQTLHRITLQCLLLLGRGYRTGNFIAQIK